MSNQELVQYVKAPKSVEPTVRSVSRFKELPFWKKGITLATLGLSTIAAACSDTAGNETTITPPPTSPTTITTEVPTTTTTEAPSTTTSTIVPETTTTTTEAPVDDITKASGNIYDNDKRLDKLGLVKVVDFPSNIENDYVLLVIPVSLELKTIEDYQGFPKGIYTLIVSAGQREDGSAYLREYMLDVPNQFNGFFAQKQYTRNFQANTGDSPLTFKDEELITLLNQMIDEKREIGIYLPYEFSYTNDLKNCNTDSCNHAKEIVERFEYNNNTYNDLISQSSSGVIRNVHASEPLIGAISQIALFPPIGGW